MPKILVADDHAVVRAGYKQFLEQIGSYASLGEASSAQETRTQLRAQAWDVLLLDIGLPDGRGLSLLQEVRAEFPQVKVLVVSGLPEEQYAVEVLRAGGFGYLSKQCAASELVGAVRKVLGGQRYISPALAEQMASEVGQPRVPRHELLSGREIQVFERLARGSTITAIAEELRLSIKTVSTYRARILEKMRLKGNSDITSYALRHDLVPVPAVLHAQSERLPARTASEVRT